MKKFLFLLIAYLITASCLPSNSNEVYTTEDLKLYSLKFQYDEHDMILFYAFHREGFSVLHSPECNKCKSKDIKDFNSIYDLYGN